MKKLIYIFILTFISLGAYSQNDTREIEQKTSFEKRVDFQDSVRAFGLTGSGTYLKIIDNVVVKGESGLGATSLSQDSVIGLVDSIAALRLQKQDTLIEGFLIDLNGDTVAVDSASLVALIQSVTGDTNSIKAGIGILKRNDSLFTSNVPIDSLLGWSDTAATFQRVLTAGSNITISNDTISSTGGGQWTRSGNYVYVESPDSVGIGTSSPVVGLDVRSSTRIQLMSSGTSLEVQNISNGTALSITSALGTGLELNSYGVSSISNDTTLVDEDSTALVTEYAVKKYVDNSGGASLTGGTGITVASNEINRDDGFRDTTIEVTEAQILAFDTDSVELLPAIANNYIDIDRIVVFKASGSAYSNIADSCQINMGFSGNTRDLNANYMILSDGVIPSAASCAELLGFNAYATTIVPTRTQANESTNTGGTGVGFAEIGQSLVISNKWGLEYGADIGCSGSPCPSLKVRISYRYIDVTE